MAFQHGKETKVFANGWDITSYLTEFAPTINGEAIDVTTFGDTWRDFITGLKMATFTANGFFDGADDAQDEIVHGMINTLGSIWLWFPQGDTLGNYGYGLSGIETSYNPTTPIGGASTFTVSGTALFAQRAVSLHAMGAETADGDGTSVDNAAGTSAGGAGYLEVFAYSGLTDIVVKVQHSTDNAVWADLITFTTVTAARQKERSAVSGTVNRYVRANWDVTGIGSATFALAFHRG